MDSFLEKFTVNGNPVGIRVGWIKGEMVGEDMQADRYGYVNPYAFYLEAMREMMDVINAEIRKMVTDDNQPLDAYKRFEVGEAFRNLGYKELYSQYASGVIGAGDYVIRVPHESLPWGERFLNFMVKLKSLGYVH